MTKRVLKYSLYVIVSDAAFKILNPKAVPKFFRLNSHNAILEFLLEVVDPSMYPIIKCHTSLDD